MRLLITSIILLATLLASIQVNVLGGAASLDQFAEVQLLKKELCAPCPKDNQPGDSRCRLSYSIGTIDKTTGCPSCGCQKCPDQEIYANSVTDYCKTKPSTNCAAPRRVFCRIQCLEDKRCETLEFDRDINTSPFKCDKCPCQICPDGGFYRMTSNYTNTDATPLTIQEAQECPNVLYPIQPYQNFCF